MLVRRPGLTCALSLLWLFAPLALAAGESDAARLAAEGRFDEAAAAYRALVAANPQSVRLRLGLADALTRDRRWDEALAEYEQAIKLSPNNAEALSSIGTIRRWQGHIDESVKSYERMRAAAPQDPAAVLGLAGAYAADHDFTRAQQLYDEAARRWPGDRSVQNERYNFARQANPRVYVYFEDDLSFQTRIGGGAVPFLAREEIAAERQQELRFLSQTGEQTFVRTDNRLLYTHYFGFNHALETSLKSSSFTYNVPTTSFTAIDRFDEVRVRYAVPVNPEQVASARYTARPTTLIGGEKFTSHKVEAEIQSQWNPSVQTTLGTGLLHDLKDTAVATSDTTNQVLWRLGAQVTLSDRADVSLRYITNPDLDSSIYSTTLVQAGYTFSGTYSGIVRMRFDDYKAPPDQSSYYAGVRITPDSHLWTDFGIKYVTRGVRDGFFGLASVVYRF